MRLREETWDRQRLGSSAVVGSFGASSKCGVAEESEDPWLCDPGFCRVCPYRGMGEQELRVGTGDVNKASISHIPGARNVAAEPGVRARPNSFERPESPLGVVPVGPVEFPGP
jgi:hypothetical protein